MTAQRALRDRRAAAPYRPYLRNTPGRRAQPADPVTGVPLRPDGLFIRVSDERLDNTPRPVDYRDGYRADVTPCPLRLHTPEVEGHLGGHAFTRQFAHYMASGIALLRLEAQHSDQVWWGSSYGRLRVKARFIRADGRETGERAWRIALAIESGYLSTDEVVQETGLSAKAVRTIVSRARSFAWQPAVQVVRPIMEWRRPQG